MRIWLMAARLRTLPAAIAPVLVGTAAAVAEVDEIRWLPFGAALVGAVFIQIGTNLANDYSDARRGADSVDRLGPVRVTAQGLATPRRVLIATWAAFAVALVAGVLYTGGPRPYGYEGLGEAFVFLFFGLVAVNGSYYVQLSELDGLTIGLSVLVGMLSASILVVNNVRDLDTDARAEKRTLAVRIGRARTRSLYAGLIAASFLGLPTVIAAFSGPGWALLGLLAAPLAVRPVRAVSTRTDGPALNQALADTGALLAGWSVLVSCGLLLG